MNYRRSIQRFLLVIVLIIAIFLHTTLNALAKEVGNQSNNQDLNQSAMLVAPEKDFQIAIYAQPNAQQQRIGYGLSGDRLRLLQQVGSNTGKIWNLVRFENPPYAEGWVSGEYLSIPKSIQNPNNPAQKKEVNGYLGGFQKQEARTPKSPSNQNSGYTNNQNQN